MAQWTISIILWLLAGSFIYVLSWVGQLVYFFINMKGMKEGPKVSITDTRVSKLIYTYFISPLSSIPNAGILAPVSRLLWAFPSEHRGRITLDLPRLHEKYGMYEPTRFPCSFSWKA